MISEWFPSPLSCHDCHDIKTKGHQGALNGLVVSLLWAAVPPSLGRNYLD